MESYLSRWASVARAGQVINGDKIDLGIAERGAKNVAANAAEAIDANLNCHALFSFVIRNGSKFDL